MSTRVRTGLGVVIALSVVGSMPAAAQKPTARHALSLPATGTFERGGSFTGTITINRFEKRGNQIVAVGFVSGALRRGSETLGSGVAGEVVWPVHVSSGGVSLVRGATSGQPTGQLMRVAWSAEASGAPTLARVQAQSCPVLNIALGPNTVDLLGAQVALGPVTLDLTGVQGTPLGDLVCAASDLLGNVAGLVNLLNSILGLVTGLLGGLTGGLGGLGGGALPVQ
jgi:hypothetical protein